MPEVPYDYGRHPITVPDNEGSRDVYPPLLIPGPIGETGPQGQPGPQGPQGPQGPPGDGVVDGVISLPNVDITYEANPAVNALQLGLDGPGPHKGQHISTADNTDDGLGAELTLNPGASKGVNKPGQPLRLASGLSTGNTGDGPVTILTASMQPSGDAIAPQTDCVYFWGANLEKAVTPGTNGLQDLGYPTLKWRTLYATGVMLTSPDGTVSKLLSINNAGQLVLDGVPV